MPATKCQYIRKAKHTGEPADQPAFCIDFNEHRTHVWGRTERRRGLISCERLAMGSNNFRTDAQEIAVYNDTEAQQDYLQLLDMVQS